MKKTRVVVSAVSWTDVRDHDLHLLDATAVGRLFLGIGAAHGFGAQPIIGGRTPRGGRMTPARLVVTRDAPDDVGDRQIILSLDSEHWTTLLFGRSATREVPPGRHRLKADNTLFRKTVEFDLAPGRGSAVRRGQPQGARVRAVPAHRGSALLPPPVACERRPST